MNQIAVNGNVERLVDGATSVHTTVASTKDFKKQVRLLFHEAYRMGVLDGQDAQNAKGSEGPKTSEATPPTQGSEGLLNKLKEPSPTPAGSQSGVRPHQDAIQQAPQTSIAESARKATASDAERLRKANEAGAKL